MLYAKYNAIKSDTIFNIFRFEMRLRSIATACLPISIGAVR